MGQEGEKHSDLFLQKGERILDKLMLTGVGLRTNRLLPPYKEYLVKRWNDGCRNAQQVYREIKEQGYTGSDQPIARFSAQFREKKERRKFKQVDPSNATPVKVAPKRPPTACQMAHWITFKEDQRLEWQQQYLMQLCKADQGVAQTYELIQEFTSMLRERNGEGMVQGFVQKWAISLGGVRHAPAVASSLSSWTFSGSKTPESLIYIAHSLQREPLPRATY